MFVVSHSVVALKSGEAAGVKDFSVSTPPPRDAGWRPGRLHQHGRSLSSPGENGMLFFLLSNTARGEI